MSFGLFVRGRAIWRNCRPPSCNGCVELFTQSACGYDLARELKVSPAVAVQCFLPLVQQGIVMVRPFEVPEPPKPQGPKVACVDDSPAILTSVTQILHSGGYQVIPIGEPNQVMATLEREKPALVLLDLLMPDLNGYDLCKLIRQHPELRQTPIVFFDRQGWVGGQDAGEVVGGEGIPDQAGGCGTTAPVCATRPVPGVGVDDGSPAPVGVGGGRCGGGAEVDGGAVATGGVQGGGAVLGGGGLGVAGKSRTACFGAGGYWSAGGKWVGFVPPYPCPSGLAEPAGGDV
jgi:hypothetical protein